MAKASTAMEAIDAALAAAGMTCEKEYGDTYISSVTTKDGVTLGAFTNGKNSGWLYSVNGKDPDVGACNYQLSDGDEVIFHYTDDYKKENVPEDHQHNWGAGFVTKNATCTENGVLTYLCKCGETKTEIIPATGHKFGNWEKVSDATVFAPKNRYEFQDAIAFAADFEAPMAIRYPKTDAVRVLKEYREPIKLGKSEWIRRGSRVALLAIGTMVETAMEVEELLAKDGSMQQL